MHAWYVQTYFTFFMLSYFIVIELNKKKIQSNKLSRETTKINRKDNYIIRFSQTLTWEMPIRIIYVAMKGPQDRYFDIRRNACVILYNGDGIRQKVKINQYSQEKWWSWNECKNLLYTIKIINSCSLQYHSNNRSICHEENYI